MTGLGSRNLAKTPARGAELRLRELGIALPEAPRPFGIYAEAVLAGDQLFLSGMLPTRGRELAFTGRVGAELDVAAGQQAAQLAALNGLAVAREFLGSLDKISGIVRLGVSIATSDSFREHPKVADGASELLQNIFGREKNPTRLIFGVATLPLGAAVELELIFAVGGSRAATSDLRRKKA